MPLTRSFTVILIRAISRMCSSFEHIFRLICSSARSPLMHANFPSIRMLVILNPSCMYTCLTCLMDSYSVDAFELEIYSSVIILIYLEMVLIKRIPLMNMMSPASVTFLYLSRMAIGRGGISLLMCGVFCLGVFPFRYTRFFPNVFSSYDVV